MAQQRLIAIAKHVLGTYSVKEAHVASIIPTTDRDIVRAEQYRELVAWNEIVVDVIGVIDTLDEAAMAQHLAEFLPGLFGLISCESVEVREHLRDFMLRRCSCVQGLLLSGSGQ